MRTLCALKVNGRSQNETDGFRAKFLTRYAQEGDEFLDSIVTGNETWGFHHTPESNQQSLQWRHTPYVVQRAGGRLLCLGDTEAGSKT